MPKKTKTGRGLTGRGLTECMPRNSPLREPLNLRRWFFSVSDATLASRLRSPKNAAPTGSNRGSNPAYGAKKPVAVARECGIICAVAVKYRAMSESENNVETKTFQRLERLRELRI